MHTLVWVLIPKATSDIKAEVNRLLLGSEAESQKSFPQYSTFFIHVLFVAVWSTVLASCLVQAEPTPNARQRELEGAVQKYLDTVYQAELNMDTTQLDEVATGSMLASHINRIDFYRDNPNEFVLEEIRNLKIEEIDFSGSQALVRVRYDYRQFSRDLTTGERNYGTSDNWHWRTEQFTMLVEDSVWKVSDTEFIDWSG
jgi:hypothetical protein